MPPLTSKDSTAPLIINLVEQLKDLDAKQINEVAKALSMAKKEEKDTATARRRSYHRHQEDKERETDKTRE